jgi:hypothetical protein
MQLRQARRRDAGLKRAAVTAALLRAEAARAALAAEHGAKGAGGKGGKGGDDDREEMCAICQCEFTVDGDSGTYLVLLVSGSLGPLPLVEISMSSPRTPCDSYHGLAGEGLKCPGFHFMCSECAGVFVSSVLGDLDVSFPPKCPICRCEESLRVATARRCTVLT